MLACIKSHMLLQQAAVGERGGWIWIAGLDFSECDQINWYARRPSNRCLWALAMNVWLLVARSQLQQRERPGKSIGQVLGQRCTIKASLYKSGSRTFARVWMIVLQNTSKLNSSPHERFYIFLKKPASSQTHNPCVVRSTQIYAC